MIGYEEETKEESEYSDLMQFENETHNETQDSILKDADEKHSDLIDLNSEHKKKDDEISNVGATSTS